MRFWNNLNSRERIIVVLGLPLTILVALYLYYWQPFIADLNKLRQQIPEKQVELAWVKHKISQTGPLLSNISQISSDSPTLTIIEAQAIKSRIKQNIQRVQPSDKEQVKIWFQEVIADHWLEFIDQLSAQGIAVETAIITRTKDGRVNARVTFKR